jgi:hypothetical protein
MVMAATPWMVMRGQARICEIGLVLAVTQFRHASVSSFTAPLGPGFAASCEGGLARTPAPRPGDRVVQNGSPGGGGSGSIHNPLGAQPARSSQRPPPTEVTRLCHPDFRARHPCRSIPPALARSPSTAATLTFPNDEEPWLGAAGVAVDSLGGPAGCQSLGDSLAVPRDPLPKSPVRSGGRGFAACPRTSGDG